MTNAILPPYVSYYLKGNDTQLPSHRHVNSSPLIMTLEGGEGVTLHKDLKVVKYLFKLCISTLGEDGASQICVTVHDTGSNGNFLPNPRRKWEYRERRENGGEFLSRTWSSATFLIYSAQDFLPVGEKAGGGGEGALLKCSPL